MNPCADVLNSWKEIAAYLGRGVRTVQRWEAAFGLPVRRPNRKRHSTVIALRSDIDLWLKSCPVSTTPSTTHTLPSTEAAALLSNPSNLLVLKSSTANNPGPKPPQKQFRIVMPPSASLKILLIDADRQVAVLRKRILENAGYSVTLTIWPTERPQEFQSFDAILLGHAIPSDQRRDISKTIRERDTTIPIITICSQPGEIDRAATFCISPLNDPEAVLDALHELFSTPQTAARRTFAG